MTVLSQSLLAARRRLDAVDDASQHRSEPDHLPDPRGLVLASIPGAVGSGARGSVVSPVNVALHATNISQENHHV